MSKEQVLEYELYPSGVTAEQVLVAAREIWGEMQVSGSVPNAALAGLGLAPADLPSAFDEALSIKGSGAGFDAATITLIVATIGGAVGAKLPGMVSDTWKYVVLPQLRARWGDKALLEKAKKTTQK